MAMSRSFGRSSLTTRPPISIPPASASSRPAIVRSRVLLPQPDGPTSTANSPAGTVKVDASDGVRRAVGLVQRRGS